MCLYVLFSINVNLTIRNQQFGLGVILGLIVKEGFVVKNKVL